MFGFAKMRGYPSWPARKMGQNKNKIWVHFYGTNQFGSIPTNNWTDLSQESHKKFGLTNVGKAGYDVALKAMIDATNQATVEKEAKSVDNDINEERIEPDETIDTLVNVKSSEDEEEPKIKRSKKAAKAAPASVPEKEAKIVEPEPEDIDCVDIVEETADAAPAPKATSNTRRVATEEVVETESEVYVL